jgi:hypothetical protein
MFVRVLMKHADGGPQLADNRANGSSFEQVADAGVATKRAIGHDVG